MAVSPKLPAVPAAWGVGGAAMGVLLGESKPKSRETKKETQILRGTPLILLKMCANTAGWTGGGSWWKTPGDSVDSSL